MMPPESAPTSPSTPKTRRALVALRVGPRCFCETTVAQGHIAEMKVTFVSIIVSGTTGFLIGMTLVEK